MRHPWTGAMLLALGSGVALSATPPDSIHYQGVLRGAADEPLAGDYDMVFRFFDAETGGNEILVDSHLAANAQAVTVTGGLFSAALGGGEVLDGAGAGTHTSVADVFRDHLDVWLSVQVETETLVPRTRVLAAAYAHNATNFDGRPSSAFLDTSNAAQTKAGALTVSGDAPTAITGHGTGAGGFFSNAMGSEAYVAWLDFGIQGYGTAAGGVFRDLDGSGVAHLGYGGTGIDSYGPYLGGYFRNSLNSEALLASGENGIAAYGSTAAAFFYNGSGDTAYVGGWGGYGLRSSGSLGGGFFDTSASGEAYVAWSNFGIQGFGNEAGGYFRDLDGSGYAYVGYFAHKILGTGAVSFVQNHPYDRDKVIVYAAPEGDEVATYTRGSGKLVDGVARVALGPTFAWVTDPDIGLTAHLTARGLDPVALVVESLTTSELVVRGPAGADAAFDFLVYGLRIGFEELSVVREKKDESRIPSMSEDRARYEKRPELRAFNALERFKDMAAKVDGTAEVDRSRGAALRAAIEEYDPAVHGPVSRPNASELPAPQPVDGERVEPAVALERHVPREEAARDAIVAPRDEVRMPVAEAVEEGDLLVLDLERPGLLRRATSAADPTVVGIAARAPEAIDGQLSVALVEVIGIVRADAGYGAIRPGDLLASSPTPGHAMRAADPLPGTVVGKALESLDVGTGQIRVLVLPR